MPTRVEYEAVARPDFPGSPVSVSDVAGLEELRQALAHCASALASYRTDLIESLGDSLCGAGPGPLPHEVARLEHLEQTHDALRRAYREARERVGDGEVRGLRQ